MAGERQALHGGIDPDATLRCGDYRVRRRAGQLLVWCRRCSVLKRGPAARLSRSAARDLVRYLRSPLARFATNAGAEERGKLIAKLERALARWP